MGVGPAGAAAIGWASACVSTSSVGDTVSTMGVGRSASTGAAEAASTVVDTGLSAAAESPATAEGPPSPEVCCSDITNESADGVASVGSDRASCRASSVIDWIETGAAPAPTLSDESPAAGTGTGSGGLSAGVSVGAVSICSHGMAAAAECSAGGSECVAGGGDSCSESTTADGEVTRNICPVTVSNMAAKRKATGLPGASERILPKRSLARSGLSLSGSSSNTSIALPYSATAAMTSPLSSYTCPNLSKKGTQRGPAVRYSRKSDSASQ